MNLFFVGAFNEKRCTFNIQAQETKGINLILPFSYAFINISFSIRNSTIWHAQGPKDFFGIFIDCDFSSKSPLNSSGGSFSKVKEQLQERAKGYNFSKSAEENEQRNLR